jgi:WD40 repeat protein
MPDAARLVEVRAQRQGSGYLITDRLVLTAWHVIRPAPGAPLPQVAVRVEARIAPRAAPVSVEEPAQLLWPQEEPGEDLDFALLLLAAPLPVEPVSWAALAESGRLEVQTIGYPDVAIDAARRLRDTKEVSGWTRLGDRLRERREGRGTFEIRMADEDQPPGPPAAAWPAMSGAAVFAAEVLIGVIRLASSQNQRGILDALPVERLLTRPDVHEAAQRAGCALPRRLVAACGAPADAQRLTYRWPQAWDFEAYMEEKRGGSFQGREWLFREIDAWRASGEARALLIRAAFGVGKSALLAEYVRRQRGEAVLAWHFCQHDTQATLRPGTFVRSIATQLAQNLPAYREAVEESLDLQKALDEADADPGSSLEAAVLAPLSRLSAPPQSRILVIDALDEGLELAGGAGTRTTIVDLLARKAGRFPPWLRVLASSRPNPAVLTPLSSAFAPAEIDAGAEGNREDLRAFVLARCAAAQVSARLAAAGLTPQDCADLLLTRSGGKFLLVVHALRDLASGALTPGDLASLPPGMDSFYLDFFQRRFGADAARYGEVAPLLSVMCAAQEPLTRAELSEVLEISLRSVQMIQARLPDFLRLRAERLSFDHASLKEWLTLDGEDGLPRAAVFAIDLSDARARLTRWARARVAAGTAHESLYLLADLAAHLPSPAERRDVYAQLLLASFPWSCARLASAGVPGLLADAEHLAGHPEQGLFQDLVRNSELALRRSPSQWRAQVLGRLGTQEAGSLGLPQLAASARVFLAGSAAPEILVPATRSLRWVSGQDVVLDGEAPLLALPDGRIVSEGPAHALRIWDRTRRAEPLELAGHTKPIEALALLPDGRIVSGGQDRSVRVWDPQLLTPSLVLKGHSGAVLKLAALPDGRIVSGGAEGTVRVWHPSGAPPLILEGHTQEITALAVLPDGRIASGADDACVRIWDLAHPQDPQVLEGHEARVVALLVLPDDRLASSSWDATIRIWSRSDGRALRTLDGHAGAVGPLALLSDGRLVSGADDGSVRIWDLSGRCSTVVLAGHTDWVWRLAVLPDDRIVSGSHDGTVRVWSMRAVPGAPPSVVFRGHSGKLRALALLPDGRVASAADDRTVRVWDPAHQVSVTTGDAEAVAVEALAALPDGRAAWGAADGGVQISDLSTAAPTVLKGHTAEVRALAVLPDGRVASAARDRTVRVWDLTGRHEPRVLTGHSGAVDVLAVLPGGRLASGGWDRCVRVWDLARPGELQVFKGHTDRIRALATHPDGRIISGGADGTVRVWDPTPGTQPQVLEGHTACVRALAVLPDGRIVSASRDRTLRVWDLKDPDRPLVLEGHTGRVRALALLPDGRIASGATDGTVRLWDLRAGIETLVLAGHEGEVRALAVLPDGRVASSGDDHTVRVWPQGPHQTQRSFIADAPVLSLSITAAGLLLAGCKDGAVHLLSGS